MTHALALIIEDDPTLGNYYRTVLEQAGFETDLDPDGNQYPQKITAPNLAVILLDLHMPYKAGIDILHEIRADARWNNIPIIVTTADFYLAKTIEGQAEHILIKPVSISQLLKIVTPFLS
jgi:DNA-binding response OmpR family regulator